MERQIGCFYITSETLLGSPMEVASILHQMGFVPIRVERRMDKDDCFEYCGLSPQFKAVPPGVLPPFYEIIVDETEDGHAFLSEVKESKDFCMVDRHFN